MSTEVQATTTSSALIYQAMPAIMADVDPISKARKNTQQGYSFRGIDDVYQALQVILSKHGVFTTSEIISDRTEERTTSKGNVLIYRVLKIRWHFHAKDGSSVWTETIGEGMDSGDKASNKAMSVAHKYALLQAFCIPTEEPKDPENESHELQPKGAPAAQRTNGGGKPVQSAPKVGEPGGPKPLDRIKAMLMAYKQLGVTEQMLEAYAKTKLSKLSSEGVDELRNVYDRIRSGERAATFFPALENTVASAADLNAQLNS